MVKKFAGILRDKLHRTLIQVSFEFLLEPDLCGCADSSVGNLPALENNHRRYAHNTEFIRCFHVLVYIGLAGRV